MLLPPDSFCTAHGFELNLCSWQGRLDYLRALELGWGNPFSLACFALTSQPLPGFGSIYEGHEDTPHAFPGFRMKSRAVSEGEVLGPRFLLLSEAAAHVYPVPEGWEVLRTGFVSAMQSCGV